MAIPSILTTDPTTRKPPRRRRRIPVSLWIFAAALFLFTGGGACWIGVRESRQNAAIKEIVQLGGEVEMQSRDFGQLGMFLGANWRHRFSDVGVVRVNRASDLNRISPHFTRLSPLPRLHVRHTPIHKSVEDGELERTAALLGQSPLLVHARDYMDQTPLHIASHKGHVELIRLLVERGAEINARAYNGFTPLHLAREPAVVDLLARSGADLNAVGASGTALQRAATDVAHFERIPRHAPLCKNARSICAILLDRGAEYGIAAAVLLDDLNWVRSLVKHPGQAQDKDAMRTACSYGRAAIVRLLLDNGADPEDANSGGLPLSYFAIEHPQVLQMLFDAGADPAVSVNYVGNGHGPQDSTLLHEAAGNGAVESVRILLRYGLPVNSQDGAQNTPLHRAVFGDLWADFGRDGAVSDGNRATVDLLLDHKADPSIRNHQGLTPLAVAAERIQPSRAADEEQVNKRAIVERLRAVTNPPEFLVEITLGNSNAVKQLLLEAPALANQPDPSGEPPLQRAISLDQRQVAAILLAAGADANGRDEHGSIALHTAACCGREDLARMLLAQGADPNLADRNDFTPLHEAARCRTWGVARLLIDAGANAELQDDNDRTALDILRKDQFERARTGRDELNQQDEQGQEIMQLLSKTADPLVAPKPVGAVQNLNLSRQDLRDDDLARLDGMQGLEWLAINRNPISDIGLQHVAPLTSLMALRLEHTKITDRGLFHLQGLTRLRVLSLKGTNITDVGLERLLWLSKLRHLDLSQTQVGDAGLSHLKVLTALTELRVDQTRVTKDGIAELQQALPRLKIDK
jgi:ankyrin repeat protein